ncbi:hypothetical protein BpHYR1_000875 [Brachionus plicatilis]|uniref:Uncharacterized protein n=1 Tax=Brachionus plicatilis TaxID=10195 RepID=A0A3M7R8C7_BRAPC|nr:hypothetical protein BpHYR1_000875 [Brachionus plicatilis]
MNIFLTLLEIYILFHYYQFDPFVYASLLIREKEYERCLCKVICKEIIKIDFQNSDIRSFRENNKILNKHVNSN